MTTTPAMTPEQQAYLDRVKQFAGCMTLEQLRGLQAHVSEVIKSVVAEGFDCVCAHCRKAFKSKREDGRICVECFVAGHRGWNCDHYCTPSGVRTRG